MHETFVQSCTSNGKAWNIKWDQCKRECVSVCLCVITLTHSHTLTLSHTHSHTHTHTLTHTLPLSLVLTFMLLQLHHIPCCCVDVAHAVSVNIAWNLHERRWKEGVHEQAGESEKHQ